jgi:hypothetical protein
VPAKLRAFVDFLDTLVMKEKKSNLSAIGKMSDSLSGIDCGRQRAETAAGRCKISMNINHA